MSKWKKIVAGLMATAMVGSLAACGSNTAYAMTIDGMQVKAGVYIYFAYSAYSEAVSTLQSQNSELDTSDNDVVKAQKIDGKDTETWIKDKTLEYCQQYVAVEQKYSELSLELSDESKTEIDNTLNNFWDTNSKTFEANGISKESVKLVLENTYHTNDLFLYYYDIDGEEGVTEDELKEYYIDNDARVRYIKIDLKDGNGDLLKSDAKDAMLEQVNGYLKRVEAKEGDEEAMLDEMDAIQTDYNAYVTSISEEAAAETATSATDENGNEIAATTTTTAATTTTAETTTAVTEEDSAAATKLPVQMKLRKLQQQRVCFGGNRYRGNHWRIRWQRETTTTTSKYANETIIAKVTTNEKTKEEDITYTPSKKAYDYIFNDAKLGVPAVVEDDEACYLVLRLDIEERMTDDDLWSDTQKTSVVTRKYSDAFEDMLDQWCDAQTVEKNDRAIKRYDAFDLDFSSK
ncbi:MAG: hypothetical protein ACLT2C_08885 [Ruminococcus sp.]